MTRTATILTSDTSSDQLNTVTAHLTNSFWVHNSTRRRVVLLRDTQALCKGVPSHSSAPEYVSSLNTHLSTSCAMTTDIFSSDLISVWSVYQLHHVFLLYSGTQCRTSEMLTSSFLTDFSGKHHYLDKP